MNTHRQSVLRSVLFGSAAAACLIAPGLALAQQSPAAAKASNEVTEVVVTGSRIPRPDLTATEPVTMVSGQLVQDKGITNLANAVNLLPSTAGSITTAGGQGSFGTGRNFINLFNLGSQRTLTLVNGRRFVTSQAASLFSGSSPGNQVDLNELPTAFVDHIETVAATGAAVYGSDAIAGVVNILYKDRFEGVLLDGQYGESSRSDYPSSHITAAVGHDFLDGKANLAFDFELDKTGSLIATDRPRTAAQLTFARNPVPGGSANILISNRTVPELTQGGLVYISNSITVNPPPGRLASIPDPNNPGGRIPVQFAPDGTLVPYNIGTFFQPSISSGGQGLSLAPLSSLETPVHRKLGNIMGMVELTPNVRLHGTLFYAEDKSTAPANQPIFQSGLFGGSSGNLQLSINNPFLTPQARAIIQGTPGFNGSTFFLARASTDIVGLSTVQSQTKAFDLNFTLEGDFNALDRDFKWNASLSNGQTKAFFISPGINQANFALAINAVTNPANGQIVCASTLTNPTNGCQPLNLFGQGAPSAAALQFIQASFRSDDEDKQTDAEANLTGTVWKLPAADWSFNLGAEYREEKATFRPDLNSQQGIGRSVPIAPASGSYDTRELYAETLIPILGPGLNFLGGRKLEFEGAYRKVHNSLAGSGDAWSYGFRYSPIEDLTFRGSKSKTFRAPAITELFLPTSSAFSTATDPCDAANINAGPNPATRAKNCAADFAKLGATLTGFKSNIQVATAPITTSGNSSLKNEIGNSYTYGVVWQPEFVPGLAVAYDYIHIDLTDAIVNFGASSILSTCYDSPAHPADVCSRFVRDNTGQVTTVAAGFVNAGFTHFSGDTYTVSYRNDLNNLPVPYLRTSRDLGTFSIDLNVFHTRALQSSVSGTGFDLSDVEGTIGNSRWRYLANVRWDYQDFGAVWTVHYIGHALFNRTFTLANQNILSVGDWYGHDLAVHYKIPRYDLTLRAGVNNIFDKQPPFPTANVTYEEGLVGRYYFVGAQFRY